MQLVDTHCHIQSIGQAAGERTTRDIWAKAGVAAPDSVIAEAVEAGVTRLICVGCDLQDSQLAIDFVQDREHCWASVGIHPHEAKLYVGRTDKLAEFAALAEKPKVVAIGEAGLDYYYEHSPKADQIEILKFQLEMALKHDLPLIFHIREAFDDFWPVFDSYKNVRGVLHSFTDSPDNMAMALDRGLYIGVNGIATFAKNPVQLEVYKTVPLEKLLLETDSPFLTPTPYRGNVNSPKQVGRIAEFLADLRGQDVSAIAEATTANARQLFGV